MEHRDFQFRMQVRLRWKNWRQNLLNCRREGKTIFIFRLLMESFINYNLCREGSSASPVGSTSASVSWSVFPPSSCSGDDSHCVVCSTVRRRCTRALPGCFGATALSCSFCSSRKSHPNADWSLLAGMIAVLIERLMESCDENLLSPLVACFLAFCSLSPGARRCTDGTGCGRRRRDASTATAERSSLCTPRHLPATRMTRAAGTATRLRSPRNLQTKFQRFPTQSSVRKPGNARLTFAL